MPQSIPFQMGSKFRMLLLAVFACLLMVLSGCTGGQKPVVEPTTAVVEEAPQDSLRAKFLLTITDEDGKPQELDAVLFSVPKKRYRMELTGPMGIGVASMLWQEEGWVMTFPTEKMYMKGAGYMVGLLGNTSLPSVHIHQVAALFEGKLLPENYELLDTAVSVPECLKDEKVQMFAAQEKGGNRFFFAKKDSNVVWLSRKGMGGKEENLFFSNFKTFDEFYVPSSIVFERDGVRYLEIKIRKIARNKPFSMGTWRLNVPRSFNQVGL